MNRHRRTGGIMLAASLLAGGLAWAGIEGSKHDFSKEEWSDGDTCGVCHGTESEPPTAAPLWDQNADLNRTFGTSLAQSKQAGGGTVICLRCHDGTIARDAISGATRNRFVNKENPGMFGTGHGVSNHPVGAPYPMFDKDFRPVTAVDADGAVFLPAGNVECISCHDPHNMSGERYMLVKSNGRSALCLTCHRK